MIITDRTMVCQDCGEDFIFTVGEQEFYQEKGFKNEPKRCNECRRMRKRDKRDPGGRSRELYSVVCAECGCDTQVPFEPKTGRPVFCKACFESK